MSEGMCAAAYGNIDSPLRAKLCCLYDRVYNLQPDRINIGANIESRGVPKFDEKKNLFSTITQCYLPILPHTQISENEKKETATCSERHRHQVRGEVRL